MIPKSWCDKNCSGCSTCFGGRSSDWTAVPLKFSVFDVSTERFEHNLSSLARKMSATRVMSSDDVISRKLTDLSYTQTHYCSSISTLT